MRSLRMALVGAVVALALSWGVPLLAQGVRLMRGDGTDLLSINTFKAAEFVLGRSTRATYRVTATGIATTALYNVTIESGASVGFRLLRYCVGVSNATAAAAVTVTVQRRTTASSAGTLVAAEATASPSVSRMDLGDGTWPGIVRVTSTLGTAGAVLDGYSFMVGEVGAGTADAAAQDEYCTDFGVMGEKTPTVPSGAANGLSINVSAPGAGGLASGSITATIVSE